MKKLSNCDPKEIVILKINHQNSLKIFKIWRLIVPPFTKNFLGFLKLSICVHSIEKWNYKKGDNKKYSNILSVEMPIKIY